ncbi:MAG: DNA-3-methyladenine glycosylase [Chloroflexota bacterium]
MEWAGILGRDFFERNTLEVAADLLGTELVFERGSGDQARVRIVETEAYMGADDLASHASHGLTRRTSVMFGPAGHAYVYLIYGFHHCLNVVTELTDVPAAVLIRGAEPMSGVSGRTDGPGRLCRGLGIHRDHNGLDLTAPPLYFLAPTGHESLTVSTGPRVGVQYAGEWADRPWRFWIQGNPWVSRPPRRTIGRGDAAHVVR